MEAQTCKNICKHQKVYSKEQETLIEKEFKRLEGHYYLEHAGATLYSERQLSDTFSDLSSNIYANPHARNLSSKLTEDVIDQVRFKILHHFRTNLDEYSIIFTSGATAALKLVAEAFEYENDNCDGNEGCFAYLEDNHSSVLGMREYANNVQVIRHDEAIEIFSKDNKKTSSSRNSSNTNSLFAFPAQCNFSGTKYPLSWIKKVHDGAINGFKENLHSIKWYVVLDAASFVATNTLDLSKYKPDFVPVSFYKIFGYPTGIGALLVKNSSAHVLKKIYFGGGTVLMALSTENVMIPRPTLHERFEDGTVPFLSIISIRHGFETLKRLKLTMHTISHHSFSLAKYVHDSLRLLHHSNGKPAVVLYHNTDFSDVNLQGGIVNFNLLRSTGNYIGFSEVLQFANLYGIHLRTGCFCNPGACQRHLKLSTKDVKYHFQQGHVCGDQKDLIDGYPTGSVRISFGYMSTSEDADMILKMIFECFIDKPVVWKQPIEERNNMLLKECISGNNNDLKDDNKSIIRNVPISIPNVNLKEKSLNKINNGNFSSIHNGYLKDIFLYPIKSCAAFAVSGKWELVSTGLKYDREWMIVNSAGVCITQKQDTRLCLIKPEIDLENGKLHLNFEGYPSISVNLLNDSYNEKFAFPCQSKVCGDRIQAWDCGNEVALWLGDLLGYPGVRLLRQCNNHDDVMSRTSKNGQKANLSLANQAQFLLVNTASVQWLLNKIPKNNFYNTLEDTILRFRPNFVVKFSKAFVEKNVNEIQIGDNIFKYEKPCTRCQMICIDQATGEKTLEPLKTLSLELGGKVSFGIYLKQENDSEGKFIETSCEVKTT